MPVESTDEGAGDATYVSIPRGGPIYVSDMVSIPTAVPEFELSICNELQSLKAELDFDTPDEDISVDELKILREEELVNKALEEAFKDGDLKIDNAKFAGEMSSSGVTDGSRALGFEDASADVPRSGVETLVSKSLSGLPLQDCENTKSNSKNSQKKRKRHVQQKSDALEESYMAKVEELARIKHKQDQDKAAARLHSFNGSCQIKEDANLSSKMQEKMTSLKGTISAKARSSDGHRYVEVQFPEVILCVEVYHNRRTWAKAQEFLVLGRQFLTEVRDKIYCMTDEIMKKAGQNDPSGYFLIEDVFCNDLRKKSATDYSKHILHWLEYSKKEALEKWEYIINGELHQKQKAVVGSDTELQLPRFRAIEMQKTRFCDIKFRLGAGYLYCHQGDCKHVMVIRDMRLIHPEDVQNRAAYPLITFQSKLRFRKCSVCKIFKAEKITVDDKWAEENPCYFCDLCYYMLHYVNGALLYDDFSVYEYLHE